MINILTEKPQENCLLLPFLIDTLKKDHVRRYQEGNHLQTRKRALIRNQISPYPDLGLLRLQNCEKQMSVVEAVPSMVFCYGSLNWLRHWPCGVILSDAVSRVGLVRVRPCESQACGVDSVCSSSLVLQLCIHMCACVFGSHFSQRWWSNPLQWWYPKLVCRPLRYPKASQNTMLRLSLVLLAPIRLETK